MNIISYIELVAYFLTISLVLVAVLISLNRLNLRIKIQNVISTFGKEFNGDCLPLLLKEEKNKIYWLYYLKFSFDTVLFIGMAIAFYKEEFFYKIYIISSSLIFIVNLALSGYFCHKFFRRINEENFFTPEQASNFFENVILKEWKSNEYQEFKLYKNGKVSVHNNPMQFNQKHYYKKLKKIYQKNYSSYQQYKIFLRYIRDYGIFINRIPSRWKVTVSHNDVSETIEAFPKILINNFVYMVITIKQDIKCNDLDKFFKLNCKHKNTF